MMLEVAKNGNGFAVQDENETVYGPPVSTRKEAEELLKDWKAYYARKD